MLRTASVCINSTYIPSYSWEINNTIRVRYRLLIKSGPELNGRHGGGRKKVMEAHRTGLKIFTNARLLAACPVEAICCLWRAYNITVGGFAPAAARAFFPTHTHAHFYIRLSAPYICYYGIVTGLHIRLIQYLLCKRTKRLNNYLQKPK